MTAEQILDAIEEYMDQHVLNVRGSIHQDPYKSDFFRLFAEAYNEGYMSLESQPRLTAAGLGDALRLRIPDVLELPLAQELLVFWHEWTYAWDRTDRRRPNA